MLTTRKAHYTMSVSSMPDSEKASDVMATPNFADKTIWTGDNLDILRGMNSECVDLIYLDPPFNSNQNYAAPVGSKAAGAAFKDTWTLSDLDVAWMGLIADEQPAIANLLRTSGLTHGKGMQSYLTMMAVRLMEMRRVLKDTGSIYLHCDPTASHYLKMLMDAVYGPGNFRNEVSWQRTGAHSDAERYGAVSDRLLFYSKSSAWTWHRQYTPYSDEYVKQRYKYDDGDGRLYWRNTMTAAGTGMSRLFRGLLIASTTGNTLAVFSGADRWHGSRKSDLLQPIGHAVREIVPRRAQG